MHWERYVEPIQKLKKVWEEPKLFVHGDVEEITQAMYKQKGLGASDGLLFSVEDTKHSRKIS